MTQIVMPMHTNGVAGVMFGGIMMQWIDVCAGVAAMRHAAGAVLTASIDRLDFLSPVQRRRDRRAAGAGQLRRRGPRWRSAAASRPRTCARGTRRYVTKAYLTFVAVDDARQAARRSRRSSSSTDDDRRRHADAERRRTERLRGRRPRRHRHDRSIARAGAGCASPAATACGSSRASRPSTSRRSPTARTAGARS